MTTPTETKEYQHEKDIWFEFYTTFNDDNPTHAELAFFNNHYKTAEDIRKSNFEWIAEIKEHNTTEEEILKVMPNAKEYLSCGTDNLKSSININYTFEEIPDLAQKLIETLENADIDVVGNRCSGNYVEIAACKNDTTAIIAAGLCEHKKMLDENAKPYYTIHVIDDINNTDCVSYYTNSLSNESLCETLKDVINDVVLEQACRDYLKLTEIVNNHNGTFEDLYKQMEGFNHEDNDYFDVNYGTIAATIRKTPSISVDEGFEVWFENKEKNVSFALDEDNFANILNKIKKETPLKNNKCEEKKHSAALSKD